MIWNTIYGVSASFMAVLLVTVPLVVANVNDLKAEDSKIHAEQAKYELANAGVTSEIYQKIDSRFSGISIQLAQIQTTQIMMQKALEDHRKDTHE